jgi:hypothetical protein
MITRTDRIAQQLKALGLDVKVTGQITDIEDGEIEIVGTNFSVQVSSDCRHIFLVERTAGITEGVAFKFGAERLKAEQVHQDYLKAKMS